MPKISFLHDCCVHPLTKFEQSHTLSQRGRFDGGVYDSSGVFCEESRQVKIRHDHTPAVLTSPDSSTELRGSHIYGGLLQNTHFGHFVAESLTRLWAYRCLSSGYSSFIFLKRIQSKPIPGYAEQLLSLLCPGLHFIGVDQTIAVEDLAVPEPLCGRTNGFLIGHPLVRQLLSHLQIPLDGSKVYVSRSRLSASSGGFVCESYLEDCLRDEGYTIFHPQEHSLQEQLNVYSAASALIFADGSTLHLYSLVCRPDQQVFVVWRRSVIHGFGWQINSFGGPPLLGRPAVHKLWVPRDDPRKTARARAQLDFPAIHEQLCSAGMIQGPTWASPSQDTVDKEISSLGVQLVERAI